MISHVYKPRRRKNGKLVVSRLYRGRFRLQGDPAVSEVPLDTSDKQVAEKRLAEIVSERERERAGIIAPRLQRESAQRPLMEHLHDYASDLAALGRTRRYCGDVVARVQRVAQECHWPFAREICADEFVLWRSRQQRMTPKTRNEYLNSLNAFLNWMVKQRRMPDNPLKHVSRTDTRGMQQRRRAFTAAEFDRLLVVARPEVRLLYLAAAYTGLRAGELRQVVWGDLHLDGPRPHITVRASTAKNRKEAVVPVHPQLLVELQMLRRSQAKLDAPVFSRLAHPDRRIRHDIEKAGIARLDAMGRKLDFHALRYTFATMLACSGVSLRLAQELLRHSDPRLTANIYTDVSHLPTFDAVAALPWCSVGGGSESSQDTQIAPQKSDFAHRGQTCMGQTSRTENVTQHVDCQNGGRVLTQGRRGIHSLGATGFEQVAKEVNDGCAPTGYGTECVGNTQLAPHETCSSCAMLRRLVSNWRRLPRAARLAIDAIVASQAALRSCAEYLGCRVVLGRVLTFNLRLRLS